MLFGSMIRTHGNAESWPHARGRDKIRPLSTCLVFKLSVVSKICLLVVVTQESLEGVTEPAQRRMQGPISLDSQSQSDYVLSHSICVEVANKLYCERRRRFTPSAWWCYCYMYLMPSFYRFAKLPVDSVGSQQRLACGTLSGISLDYLAHTNPGKRVQ